MGFKNINPDILRDFIQKSGAKYRQNSRSYILTCPKCQKRDRLYIRKQDGRSRCMKCGPDFQGFADYVLSVVLNQPLTTITEAIREGVVCTGTQDFVVNLNDHWGEFGYDDEILINSNNIPEIQWSPDIIDIQEAAAQRGLEYLANRGISREIAEQNELRFLPKDQRVVFPVKFDGILRGWQARSIRSTQWIDSQTGDLRSIPKILTTGDIGGKCLMFQDNLKNQDHVIVCEGPIDALKAHLCGGYVATMGKGVSFQQIKSICQASANKVYIGLDPDATQDIDRLLREFSAAGKKCWRLEPPKGVDDLGDCSVEQVKERFESAKPMYTGQLFVYFRR